MKGPTPIIPFLPYSRLVGQEQIKLALELAYISPRVSGVLLSGQRGTGKSTAARAFAYMVYNALPVTLPINATEDRVVGGWDIDQLMRGSAIPRAGLLEKARGKMLYVDEINLLDDHIVNIILDVTSTGVLVVEHDYLDRQELDVRFVLVGTMNPEEGGLRPQLIDRFGLSVSVVTEKDVRKQILQTLLEFDVALDEQLNGGQSAWLEEALIDDARYKERLNKAKELVYDVVLPKSVAEACVAITGAFDVQGHRAEYTLALAARSYAALNGRKKVTTEDVQAIAPMVLQHRLAESWQTGELVWSSKNEELLNGLFSDARD